MVSIFTALTSSFFFFNTTAPTEIYTLSLHTLFRSNSCERRSPATVRDASYARRTSSRGWRTRPRACTWPCAARTSADRWSESNEPPGPPLSGVTPLDPVGGFVLLLASRFLLRAGTLCRGTLLARGLAPFGAGAPARSRALRRRALLLRGASRRRLATCWPALCRGGFRRGACSRLDCSRCRLDC